MENAKANVRNIWYMAAWAEELNDNLVARTLLDIPVVLFRDQAGAAVAMLDRCPHRFAPLSRGVLENGRIRCGYHALEFDGSGQCVKSRFTTNPPRNARVPVFKVVEQDGIIWFWPGEQTRADTDIIPSFPYINDNSLKTANGYSHIRANYLLVTDNLMDLSHVDMLHPDFGGILDRGKFTSRQDGRVVESSWFTQSVPPTTNLIKLWKECPQIVDHWFDMTWHAPGAMYLDVGVTRPGHPRMEGFSHPSLHVVVPETDQSTHYFWNGGLARDHPLDINVFRDILAHAFDYEDQPMLEAVAQRMDGQSLDSLDPVILPTDNGALRVRRLIDQLARQERSQVVG